MTSIPTRLAAFTALCGGLNLCAAKSATANDHMFPAAPAARSAISFDSKGFLVHGKRTFLVSAGMEYARVPRALWRDRLLRLKRAGFNCVEVYTFWDWHEPQEGKFAFEGDHDLDAFLKLVKEMGMYSIPRVGPYYCAEWTSGGYPQWLRFKPGVRVRENNKPFLDAVDKFFDKLMPIVAANQIHRGGSVILVQLENEHPLGWGTEEPNPYFVHLREKAVSLGLEVPYFHSGLHHGTDPARDTAMDDPKRPNPWFSTEFWSVWFTEYGPKPRDVPFYERATWKIIAHGGNGYNYYMAHGGSNFGYTNGHEDAASYDYGAAVGQAGDLRPLYYSFKRIGWFARSFQHILENSVDATNEVNRQHRATAASVRLTARRGLVSQDGGALSPGTILFLDNPGKSPIETRITAPGGIKLPAAGAITLGPGEIMPVMRDIPLMSGVTLRWAPTRILGVVPQGDTLTLVVYGAPGSPAELQFQAPASANLVATATGGLRKDPTTGSVVLETRFASGKPEEYAFTVGAKRVRILAMSTQMADRTWFVEAGGATNIVCGPGFVGEAKLRNNQLRLMTEKAWQDTADLPTLVYGPAGAPVVMKATSGASPRPTAPRLQPWQMRDTSSIAAPNYDDSTWMASATPLQMGADNDLSANAWYRTTINVPIAGSYAFRATGGDRATVFVDGTPAATGNLPAELPLTLSAGTHTLAVFTAHDGRDKLFNHLGPIDMAAPKGLVGPVELFQGSATELTGWRVLKAASADDAKKTIPAANNPGWQKYTVGADAFNRQRGFAWFQTTVPANPGAARAMLRFEGVDDNAIVFVDGKEVARHRGWNEPFEAPFTPTSPAVVTVFVENTDNTGGLGKRVVLTTRTGSPVTSTAWKLRGGPGDPLSNERWKPLTGGDTPRGPAFFRTTFTLQPPAATGSQPMWRVISKGLGHGSVWVNGHHLGRYPERIPINGLYIPENWLKSDENTLVIFDEDGKRPDNVTVEAEVAASRDAFVLVPEK